MKRLLTLYIVLAFAAPALAQYVAQDPTRYVPNAKILGLGKAYIGLADDVGSIFTNPAGAARVEGWQLSSMSGKFLDEYAYLSFSGLYPTEFGVLGIGFSGTSISGAWATTVESGSDPEDPIYTIDTTQPQMGNYNNAFVLSYANELKKLPYLNRLPQAEHLSLGGNLKLFQVALYGDGIIGGNANGLELDLGLKYRPPQLGWAQFGATAQNLLPFAMGGKLTYASGHEESYPLVVRLGSGLNLLGKENSLRRVGDHQLKLAVDLSLQPTLRDYPACWHLGLEWTPIELLSLRFGLDQDAAGDGAGGLTTVSDSTYGVGLNFGGFRFDYAYHAFAGAPSIDNHFFSLSYSFQPEPLPEKPLELLLPPDKLITFEATTTVSGTVLDYRIKKLEVNRSPLRFGLKGEFNTGFNLNIGKNKLVVEGLTADNRLLGDAAARVLRLQPFPDVPRDYWVAVPTSLLAMQQIITGYPDGTFRPEGNITRAEMCTLLIKTREQARTLGSDTSEVASSQLPVARGFGDVPANHWAGKFIATASSLGVVKGYPDRTFRPSSNITRAEGVAMVVRFAGISEEAWAGQFPDLAGAYWASPIVAGAYKAKLVEYLIGKNFEPTKLLTRGETVELLQKTAYVQDLLSKGILDWDSY